MNRRGYRKVFTLMNFEIDLRNHDGDGVDADVDVEEKWRRKDEGSCSKW